MKTRPFSIVQAAAFGLLMWGRTAQAAPPAAPELKAVQAVTVEATGPKSGDNGDKYFNIEGTANKTHASFGLLRFDAATLKKDLDSKYGAGKYKITNVTLQLTQSPAKFSKEGQVNIFFRADTTPNLNVQSLKYPYIPGDKTVGGGKIAIGSPSKTKAKAETEENVVEAYNLTNDPSGNGLKDALQAGKIVTLNFNRR